MKEPIPIEEKLPHVIQEVVCLSCISRWIDVRPENVWLKDLECPHCGETGFVIGTGQQMPDEDGE